MNDKKKYYEMTDKELFDILEGNMPSTHSAQEYASRLLSLRESNRVSIASRITAFATIILAIITGFYAFFNYQSVNIMRDQIVADISIGDINIASNFKNEVFMHYYPTSVDRHDYYHFKLHLYIVNKKSGSGSIDKPTIVLKFNGGNEFKILPDFPGTIFLKGGNSLITDFEYGLRSSEQLAECIAKHLDKLEYFIEYQNNLGKKHHLKVDDIKPYS